jgi:cyclophilin family peptidyl-prolyl cis-trans isomerase
MPSPIVILETTLGAIRVEVDPQNAPISARNFTEYVEAGHYDGLCFHRVIPGFMIQGGGMTADLRPRRTRPPIRNEAANGLRNLRGTLAMARTSVVDSATSQFFINLKDNGFLDHRDETAQGFGYAVFGQVVDGMDVVDRIAAVPTGTRGGHQNVPLQAVEIRSARLAPAT